MTFYNITPVPAPRQVRSDTWNPRPMVQRYRAFKDEVRLAKIEIPERARITFLMPMPKSWSRNKRVTMLNTPHRSRPDWDNLGKALSDAVYGEDKHLWNVHIIKLWSINGGIEIVDMTDDWK